MDRQEKVIAKLKETRWRKKTTAYANMDRRERVHTKLMETRWHKKTPVGEKRE